MIKTKGVHHITLTVSNLKKSKEFYEKVCGMKIIVAEKEYCGLSDGIFSLWLGEFRDYKPKEQKFDRNEIGLDHWAFKVDNTNELKKIESYLKDLKIPMENNGITNDDFGGTAIFTQDPDGMKIEFHLN